MNTAQHRSKTVYTPTSVVLRAKCLSEHGATLWKGEICNVVTYNSEDGSVIVVTRGIECKIKRSDYTIRTQVRNRT